MSYIARNKDGELNVFWEKPYRVVIPALVDRKLTVGSIRYVDIWHTLAVPKKRPPTREELEKYKDLAWDDDAIEVDDSKVLTSWPVLKDSDLCLLFKKESFFIVCYVPRFNKNYVTGSFVDSQARGAIWSIIDQFKGKGIDISKIEIEDARLAVSSIILEYARITPPPLSPHPADRP